MLMAMLTRYWLCNVHDLTIVTVQPFCILYSTDYDNYGIVIADGDVDGNDVTESDDNYDEYTYTSDDDDEVDDDEILTVECDQSVKINSNDKWLNNNV